jgi:hypothetical protein
LATLGRALRTIPPYAFGYNPYIRNGVYIGGPGTTPYAASLANPYASLYANPYATASLYGNPYGASLATGGYGADSSLYSNPYYGYGDTYGLYGAASVINSTGHFLVSQQDAYLKKEQVIAERVANRRRIFDENLYEREKAPTPEEERQRLLRMQLERSRNNPPVTEIWSGKALNDILADLRKLPSKPETATLRTFPMTLDEDTLKRVNVTSTRGGGNLGLLKNEGQLAWPLPLLSADFKEEREHISVMAKKAYQQADVTGQVDVGIIQQLMADVEKMNKQLRKTGADLTPAQYIEAKTFLNNLDAAITGLQNRDVQNHLKGLTAFKGKSIAELVKFMADQGLQFAPAVPGDEAAYLALHNVLANYDLVAQAQPPAPR